MKIVIVDDHALSRDGLRHLLLRLWPAAGIWEAGDFDAARRVFDENRDVDLVLLDLSLPDLRGLDGLRIIQGQYGALPVAILSATEDLRVMRDAAALGALGYIPKSLNSEATATAISAILSGGTYFPRGALVNDGQAEPGALRDRPKAVLTNRQRTILGLVAEGKTNQHIAKRLGLSANTVRAHVSAILRELGVANRTEAAHAARSLGLSDAGAGS